MKLGLAVFYIFAQLVKYISHGNIPVNTKHSIGAVISSFLCEKVVYQGETNMKYL